MSSLLRLDRKQKNSSNTFIYSRSSLENHTRFQTKMDKVYTRFQTKKAQNTTLWGGTFLYSWYKEVPPCRVKLLVLSYYTLRGRSRVEQWWEHPTFEAICGLLVLFLALRCFSPGTPVFPFPQKPTYPNSNSISNQVDDVLPLNRFYLFFCF